MSDETSLFKVVNVDVNFSSEIELLDGRETFWTLTNVICDGTVDILSQTKNQIVLQVPQEGQGLQGGHSTGDDDGV